MLNAPMWPDFALRRGPGVPGDDRVMWGVYTCTQRPPVRNGRGQTFCLMLPCSPHLTEGEIRAAARHELTDMYLRAHPDNIANTPQELLAP